MNTSGNAQILKYKHLVDAIVGGFIKKLPRNVAKDDIHQAAMVGLWDGLTRHTHVDNLEAYLRIRIQGAILDELRSQDWLPRRFREAMEDAEAEAHTSPSAVVVRIEDVSPWEQQDCLAVDQEATQTIAREVSLLLNVLEKLPSRERAILEAHYVRGVPFVDIALTMGVSQARISQLHHQALKRVKKLAA